MMNYFYGLLNLSFWGYVIVILVMTHVTVVSITLYLHRSATHRALELHPIMQHFFRFWLWISTGANTKEWVSVHRKHHATCETESDPHSPQIYGLKKVVTQGYELYHKEALNAETLQRYGQDTPDDWMERHVYFAHPVLGISLMFVLDLIFFGVPGITVWALQMMAMPFLAAGMINGVGHYFGYRNFETPDVSQNIMPWGILAGGEELHNNHHAFAASAKLSVKPWEFDIGWFYIRILQAFGLAKPRRVVPKLELLPSKTDIDVSTLKALVLHRFQVLKQYGESVIAPIVKREMLKDKAHPQLWAKALAWLSSDEQRIDASSQKKLQILLSGCNELNIAYQFKIRLQGIWTKAVANNAELVQQLKLWCLEAEQTGIQTLRQFSRQLCHLSAPIE